MKMGRLGLLINITFRLILSYFDNVSDLIMCVAYYSRSRHDPEMLFWFEVSLLFILTAYVAAPRPLCSCSTAVCAVLAFCVASSSLGCSCLPFRRGFRRLVRF